MEYKRSDDPKKGTTTLTINGELDKLTVSELRPEADRIVAKGAPRVIVDLAGLREIDSAGTGLIVSLFKRLRAERRTMEVAGVQGKPLQIFQVLRLDQVFKLTQR